MHHRVIKSAHRITVEIPEGKRQNVKTKSTWEGNIKKQVVKLWSGFI
jgi:hypothetical protein